MIADYYYKIARHQKSQFLYYIRSNMQWKQVIRAIADETVWPVDNGMMAADELHILLARWQQCVKSRH